MTPDIAISDTAHNRLNIFADLLRKWNPAINLVSPASLSDLWARHIADSAQLWTFRPQEVHHWVDLGSGAGFPGAVIAVLAAELQPSPEVTLIESDQRKAVFLSTVSRETGVGFRVLNKRIESAPAQNADVVSARALAPLARLCLYANGHLLSGGTALFLKGAGIADEVSAARKDWAFDLTCHKSKTDPSANILELRDIRRA